MEEFSGDFGVIWIICLFVNIFFFTAFYHHHHRHHLLHSALHHEMLLYILFYLIFTGTLQKWLSFYGWRNKNSEIKYFFPAGKQKATQTHIFWILFIHLVLELTRTIMSLVPNDKTLELTLFTLRCVPDCWKFPLGTLVFKLLMLTMCRSLSGIGRILTDSCCLDLGH